MALSAGSKSERNPGRTVSMCSGGRWRWAHHWRGLLQSLYPYHPQVSSKQPDLKQVALGKLEGTLWSRLEWMGETGGSFDGGKKLPLAAAVFKFTILRDGKLGGVGGRDAVAGLHTVVFLHLGQGTHQPRVG